MGARTKSVLRGDAIVRDHKLGDLVEIKDRGMWIKATYRGRLNNRWHAVDVDGVRVETTNVRKAAS